MNKASIHLGVLLTTLVAAPASARHVPLGRDLGKAGYEQIANKKGVKVYKHRTSRTIRIGADGRIPASPQQILDALLDYEDQVGKIDRLSESRVLKRGPNYMIVYQRLNLPVISDRDFTLHVKWWKKDGVTYVSYRALKGRGPGPRDGVVRVTDHSGTWQIKPVNGCRLSHVRFQVGIDLSGWLPLWMARSGAGKELPDLYTSVNRMISSKSTRRMACISN
jgi:hypothetical protein